MPFLVVFEFPFDFTLQYARRPSFFDLVFALKQNLDIKA